jgi:NAD(P)-dependent dehydrogenase (short-subunit alcohol dehydrogenase family)
MVRNNFLVSNSGVRLLLRKLRCHLHHHQKLNFPGSNHSTTAVKKHSLITPGGCLTLTSGTAALKPGKGASVGGALNGGVIVLTEGLASDLAESRVRVNVVVPGLEKSELWDKLGKTEEEQKQIFEKRIYRWDLWLRRMILRRRTCIWRRLNMLLGRVLRLVSTCCRF